MQDYSKIKQDAYILTQHQKPRAKLTKILKLVFFVLLISFVISSAFSYKVLFSEDSVLKGFVKLPVVKGIRKIVGLGGNLNGELDDRINFLILGQGGVGHEGPYLTDTIMLGSIKPSTGQVTLISIPRDFLVEVPGRGWYKINAVNSFGEIDNYDGGGSALVADVISDIFDLDIHYWIRVDFNSFKDIINSVGGLEVCVDRSFTDELYPTENYDYQVVSFEAGCQTLSSEQALIYSRSRHGNNGEGSDFARAARQQKVMLALKEKIFDWKTVFNPNLVYSLFSIAEENIQTNVDESEIVHFIKLAQKVVDSEVKKRVLDNSPSGLLNAEITDQGAYVLVPRSGDYNELRNLAKNIFVISEQQSDPENQVAVTVLNGTEVEGLASNTAGLFSSLSYTVLKKDNAPRQDYEKTVIYTVTDDDEKKQALKILKQALEANVTDDVPEFLSDESATGTDFLIVLGCDIDPLGCEQVKLKKEQEEDK